MAGRARWFGPREAWAHVLRGDGAAPLWTADPEDRRTAGPSSYWPRWWDAVADSGASLAIVDPASVAFCGANPNEGAAVRAFLAAEAERAACGVLIVAHDTKGARNETRAGAVHVAEGIADALAIDVREDGAALAVGGTSGFGRLARLIAEAADVSDLLGYSPGGD